MLKIELYMNGSKKTFSVPFIKARMFRRALELNEELHPEDEEQKTNATVEDLDLMVAFVVDLFDHQFTIDELWDGLSNEDLLPELERCMSEAVNMKKTDPNSRKRAK